MSNDKGYKGHRANSLAGKAHRLVDENPKMKRQDLIAKIKKLGASAVTAAHWISVFHNWGSRAKPKPAKAKAVVVKAKPKKKAAKPKVSSVKKPAPAPAQPAASTVPA